MLLKEYRLKPADVDGMDNGDVMMILFARRAQMINEMTKKKNDNAPVNEELLGKIENTFGDIENG